MKIRPIIATVVLLFGPALLAAFSRPAGLVAAACSVVVLVWVVLRNERRG